MVFYVLYKYAMELPDSPKEVVDTVVSKVEELVPELVSNVEELVPDVVEAIEDAAKKVDDLANDALNHLVERIPQLANAVEVVDNALAGAACSCVLFGWLLSASRARRSPAKPAVLSSEAPK
jgi:hypothetical protein